MHNKKSYIWGFINTFSTQGIYLLTNIVLAHFLTPQEFGTIGVLTIFISLSTVLTDSGMGGSLIKEQDITKDDISTVFTFNLSISIVLYLIIFFCANIIEHFYSINGLATITRILCIILIINAFQFVQKSILYKKLCFKKVAVISTLSISVASIVAFITCYFQWGVYSLVAFQITNSLIQTVLYSYNSRHLYDIKFIPASFKKLFSFGAFTTLSSIVDSIYENILSVLFGKFLGVKSVGFYDQAKKLENGSAYSLVTTINTVSFPILAKCADKHEFLKKEADSIFSTWLFISIPLLGIIALYSEFVVVLLFGNKWIGTSPYLSLLMVNGIIYIAESIIRNNIKSLGEVKQLSIITLFKRILGIGIILSFILISSYAMLYGLLLSTFLGFIINSIFYCKIIKDSFIKFFLNCVKCTLIPIVFLFILYILREWIDILGIKLISSGFLLIVYFTVAFFKLKRQIDIH